MMMRRAKIALVCRAPIARHASSQAESNGLKAWHSSARLDDLSVNGLREVSAFTGDLLCVPFFKPESKDMLKKYLPEGLHVAVANTISDIIDDGAFDGSISSKAYVTRLSGRGGRMKHIALVGLGNKPKDTADDGELNVHLAAKLGRTLSTLSKEVKASSVGIVAPSGAAFNAASVHHILVGVSDGAYVDNRYRKEPDGGFPSHPLNEINILGVSENMINDIDEVKNQCKHLNSGISFAKDLVGAPPNSASPQQIADLAKDMANEHGMECTILGRDECEKLNMGAYLGVQQGSRFEPQFVHLTYKPENPSGNVKKVALVGKGLTFDSGGYNLKVGAGSKIELMKYDMAGCGAVLGAAKAISQIKPSSVEVHFISAICENMVSRDAMRPGDILVASNGKTIEVLNTDAEGRLTLADALVYADNLKVDTIIDLATLTGACVVALGEDMAALYANDDALSDELVNAGKKSNSGIWHMPLHQSYKKQIKGDLADIKNIGGGKGAGSITAALFLEEFVHKDTQWAHIDMAGPAWDSNRSEPAGYGVGLLVNYLENTTKSHS
jgi:leucyl aminopeptidase